MLLPSCVVNINVAGRGTPLGTLPRLKLEERWKEIKRQPSSAFENNEDQGLKADKFEPHV